MIEVFARSNCQSKGQLEQLPRSTALFARRNREPLDVHVDRADGVIAPRRLSAGSRRCSRNVGLAPNTGSIAELRRTDVQGH